MLFLSSGSSRAVSLGTQRDSGRAANDWQEGLIWTVLRSKSLPSSQWLSEWYAYDKDVLEVLNLTLEERIAGFIYIGAISNC